ncbi:MULTISPECIES: glycosyltransferase family 2 protein [Bacteroidota]|uniref:glycosyltransferase family 2 protein n=1 Tax=Bacteroidota TaxID=976 RepID=UPI000DF96111|nr:MULTISPECIES: glycosyltransferase family 2 protein [Bacteroidota]QQT43602.1 glycosyltransferase family 2 protein [Sphingobacterium multivorum]SUI97897.1 Hyaluronan synthase [Sphingobacterium multivorum]
MFLSIVTPTFNRDYCLGNIYERLIKEGAKEDFEWIIIDDGSTDNTSDIVQKWIEEDIIQIRYLRKENGGKSNALVTAFNMSNMAIYSIVLDSDDFLVPNFLQIIKTDITDIGHRIIGCAYLKSDLKGNIIGSQFSKQSGSYVDIYFGNRPTTGDKIFVVNTEIYKKCLVSSFSNEKLIPESVFYMKMKEYGNFKLCNKILYKGDYLEDGLSFDVLNLVAKNINGLIYEKKLIQSQDLNLKDLLRNEIKYIAYSLAAGNKLGTILRNSARKTLTILCFVPTILVAFGRIRKIKKIRRNLFI